MMNKQSDRRVVRFFFFFSTEKELVSKASERTRKKLDKKLYPSLFDQELKFIPGSALSVYQVYRFSFLVY